MKCDNCGANVPKLYNTSWGQRICCSHCAFNPFGCRCKYGELGIAEDWNYDIEYDEQKYSYDEEWVDE